MDEIMNRRTFSLQSDQLLLKEVIKKEFLAIEIWAVNDDNPNNNFSHFVAEDLNQSLASFVDKPILGYFAQGDFKAHEGKVAKDPENDITYWDNSKGEQILGVIRSKDKVEVREKDGKKWIVVSAVLWSNYNYHQIKKIIKDKHKQVSVEIYVVDSYFTDLEGNKLKAVELKTENNKKILIIKDDEGKEKSLPYGRFIEHITKFNLSGITILGSKMGIPIKPGVEGASLSVLDEKGKELFSRQQQALCFAYQKLDGEVEETDVNTFSKEDGGTMDNQDLNTGAQAPETENFAKEAVENTNEIPKLEQNADEGAENQCQNQEQNPQDANCQNSENCAKESCGEDGAPEENCKMEGEPEQECGNKMDQNCDQNCDNPGATEKPLEQNSEEAVNADLVEKNCDNCDGKEGFAAEPASATEESSADTSTQKYEDGEGGAEGPAGHSEEEYADLLSKYNELETAFEASQQALAAQEKRVAEMEDELKKVKMDCNEYLSVKEKYETENTELRTTIASLLSEKRYEQAKELMSQNGLTQEQRLAFLKKCQDGEYNDSYDNLKKDIALAYFDFNQTSSSTSHQAEDFSVSLTRTTPAAKSGRKSRAETLASYASGH